jgi:hypothetical protein
VTDDREELSMMRFSRASAQRVLQAMQGPRDAKWTYVLSRIPVPLLGLVIAVSSIQAACSGLVDMSEPGEEDGGINRPDARATDGDAAEDAPSEDSAADRADGMSYGDGYSP